MVYQTESKFRGWRAVAVFVDGTECLVYLGRSTTQVRAGYVAAYGELLDAEEQARVREVALECWQGVADAGRWIRKATLLVPSRAPSAANDCVEHPSSLSLSPSRAGQTTLSPAEEVAILPFPGSSGTSTSVETRTRAVRVR